MPVFPRTVKVIRVWLSMIVIMALVLPSSLLLTPSTAQAALPASPPSNPITQEVVPTPAPTLDALDATYIPTFDPIPEPQDAALVPDSVAAAASEAQAAIDTEARRLGIAAGIGETALPAPGGALTIGILPFTLTVPTR